MLHIALTDQDITDLYAGHGINAMTDDDLEVVLTGEDFTEEDLGLLREGNEITDTFYSLSGMPVTCVLSYA